MISSITATYENGVFHPDTAVDLPAASRVRLIVQPIEGEIKPGMLKELDEICKDHPVYSNEPHLTRDQLHERR
jgi:predicted DNA-binding antitoxin AbrB/MazE fold protein